ncbi:general substrate transporter [Halteromyces radiatus]|uniref:general substrate transporter n=1 Tax=Halteromyces radiatus TaxID=101107 RepID=UPI0022210E54|nr:general substrate transporter [Halteromyces radiatus]KAI8099419.1 general substrate transporter [Halteromyces radiatus]
MSSSKIQLDQPNYLSTQQTESISLYDEDLKPFRKSVYISSTVAALGGALCGFDTGAISSILAMNIFIDKFFTKDTYTYLQGLLLAFYLMTAALGAFFSGFFCDRLSRKYTIAGASLIFCIGVLFQIIGYNFALLCAGRLVTGFGAGLMTNAIPLYHSEISPPDIRGRLISLFTLMSTFGQVIGYFVTFGTSYLTTDWSWRAPWMVQLFSGALFGVFALTLPFSPRWLVDQGRTNEALDVLADLNELQTDHPAVQREYNEIKTEIEFEQSLGNRTYGELFVGSNLKRTLIAFFISISTSFTGSVAIWYYSPQIMASAGLSDVSASIATSGASGILSIIATFFSLQFMIDRLGRVPVFQIGAGLMGISMFVVGAMFACYTVVNVDTGEVIVVNTNARNTIIAFIYIFTASFAFSYGMASYLYPAEIFNMRCRAKGLALTYGLNWGFSILITYCVPLFMASTVSGVYFFFGACCVVCLIGVSFIPETKGKTLEEMEILFGAKLDQV